MYDARYRLLVESVEVSRFDGSPTLTTAWLVSQSAGKVEIQSKSGWMPVKDEKNRCMVIIAPGEVAFVAQDGSLSSLNAGELPKALRDFIRREFLFPRA